MVQSHKADKVPDWFIPFFGVGVDGQILRTIEIGIDNEHLALRSLLAVCSNDKKTVLLNILADNEIVRLANGDGFQCFFVKNV